MGKGKGRVAVAMSGGVDSATAAAWLLERGYEVVGLTMHLWDHGERHPGGRTCCATEDVYDARRVAAQLGIPFYVVNLEEAFRQAVVADFIATYARGETPNPCIRCNQVLKFQLLLAKARELEAEQLATGHYARRLLDPRGHPQLWRGVDHAKDQSYFLFATTVAQLARLMFPLGDLTKEETRRLAGRFRLPVAHKAESQDVCFVPDGDYPAFFAREAPQLVRPGEIVDLAGRVVGEHRGVGCYTVGQRRGLGVGGAHGPLYVVAIDAPRNRLVVGPEDALLADRLRVAGINWLGRQPLDAPREISARIRYAAHPQPALLIPTGPGEAEVRFQTRQRAITPGQACVFHQGERVMGGGWIAAKTPG